MVRHPPNLLWLAFLVSTLNVFVEEDTHYPTHLTGMFSDGSTRDITSSATWTSDNPAVATVSNGIIYGLKSGQSTAIKVKYGNFPALSIAVTVQHDPIPLKDFALLLSEDSLKLPENSAPHQIYADLEYPDQERYEITSLGKWSSKDENVAKVDANGNVTGVNKGMTYIYFTYKYTAPTGQEGESNYDDGLLITSLLVYVGGPIRLQRTTSDGIWIDLSTAVDMPLRSYQEVTILAFYKEGFRQYDSDDVTGDIRWSIGDRSLVRVSDSGRIYSGTKEGTTTIKGTYKTFEFEFTVNVSQKNEPRNLLNLIAEPPFVEITNGQPVKTPAIKAIYSNGEVEDVTSKIAKEDWLESDPSVAHRSDDGLNRSELQWFCRYRSQLHE